MTQKQAYRFFGEILGALPSCNPRVLPWGDGDSFKLVTQIGEWERIDTLYTAHRILEATRQCRVVQAALFPEEKL